MPGPVPGDDEERLPWLESYRDSATTTAKPLPVASNKRSAGIVVGGVGALAAALTAGYLIGLRDPRPGAPPVEIALAPTTPAPIAPPLPPISQPIAEIAPPVKAAAAPSAPKVARATATKKLTKQKIRQVRSARSQAARRKAVRLAQQRPAVPQRAAHRAWPKIPSPGPAGQVIQLGAFRNPAGAKRAFQMRLARYPVLGSMPRVVVPVVTKPRGQVLYVLRLGTTSRQQSGIVCRSLRASGNHCLVIG